MTGAGARSPRPAAGGYWFSSSRKAGPDDPGRITVPLVASSGAQRAPFLRDRDLAPIRRRRSRHVRSCGSEKGAIVAQLTPASGCDAAMRPATSPPPDRARDVPAGSEALLPQSASPVDVCTTRGVRQACCRSSGGTDSTDLVNLPGATHWRAIDRIEGNGAERGSVEGRAIDHSGPTRTRGCSADGRNHAAAARGSRSRHAHVEPHERLGVTPIRRSLHGASTLARVRAAAPRLGAWRSVLSALAARRAAR
jgi:hypothetical protein